MKTHPIPVRGYNIDDPDHVVEDELRPGEPYYHIFNKPGVRAFTFANGDRIEKR